MPCVELTTQELLPNYLTGMLGGGGQEIWIVMAIDSDEEATEHSIIIIIINIIHA